MTIANIPLSSTVAAWLVVVGQICSGVGAMILTADAVPFDLDARDVGLSLVWVANIASIVVVALRKDVVPLITSGVGTEPPAGVTTTTTVEVKKEEVHE